MSRKVRSLKGRIEYDPYGLYHRGEYNIYIGAYRPYCTLYLCLYDLPVSSIVKVETVFELGAKRYRQCRAFRVPAWNQRYSAEFKLEEMGRLKIEVYTKKHTHIAEYRIDKARKRPVRQQRSKLELYLEEGLRRPEDRAERCLEKPLEFPPHSLWRSGTI